MKNGEVPAEFNGRAEARAQLSTKSLERAGARLESTPKSASGSRNEKAAAFTLSSDRVLLLTSGVSSLDDMSTF